MTEATQELHPKEISKIQEKFPDAYLGWKSFRGNLYVFINKDSLRDVIYFLKTDKELKYEYFVECTAADYSQWEHERDLEGRFEVIYNLMSVVSFSRLFIKVGVNEDETIDSITDIFLGADYPEREVSDMFGITFKGNELKQRFMMPDDWNGYPLRKEFPLGGEDVVFDQNTKGPAVEDKSTPHAGESFEGKTGTSEISGRK